jgi:beta-glucuronidase
MKKALTLCVMAFCLISSFGVPDAKCKTSYPFDGEVPGASITGTKGLGTYAQITNIDARKSVSLDGYWKYIVDPMQGGYYNYRNRPMAEKLMFFADSSLKADPSKLIEYDFDLADSLKVPGDWNTQKDKLYYYEGTVWYRHKFNYKPIPGMRTFLYFGAVNYETVIGLNGKRIGHHVGGFTPFDIEITDKVKTGANSLVLMVDDKRRKDAVPTDISDWWNYGGITRSVKIVQVPSTFIRDYSVQIRKTDSGNEIYGWIQLDGPKLSQTVDVTINGLGIKTSVKTDNLGKAEFSVKAEPILWTPENPKLYETTISSESDCVSDHIGFRFISVDGKKLYLNGHEIFCRGVSIHEEYIGGKSGRVTNNDQDYALLKEAKALGCNFVRLAHYPHNEGMVRLAEKMGIMVWSEIPVYWTIDWKNPDTYANAQAQLVDMITRDHNRANVIVWSVANETPISEERNQFLFSLIDKAKEMDSTRLVSAAMEKTNLEHNHYTVKDPLLAKADLLSFNVYMGWYTGTSEICDTAYWQFDVDKPVFISEFGCGAVYGRHGDKSERFTEEYMKDCYQRNVNMLDSRVPGLVGTTPWILKDFRSMRRYLNGTQDDFNRKGLISDQGKRKSGFFVLQGWYAKKTKEYKNR